MNEADAADLLPSGQTLFTVRQLSKFWGTSDQHVYNLIEDGELERVRDLRRVGARRAVIRITRHSIEDFLRRRMERPFAPRLLSADGAGVGEMCERKKSPGKGMRVECGQGLNRL